MCVCVLRNWCFEVEIESLQFNSIGELCWIVGVVTMTRWFRIRIRGINWKYIQCNRSKWQNRKTANHNSKIARKCRNCDYMIMTSVIHNNSQNRRSNETEFNWKLCKQNPCLHLAFVWSPLPQHTQTPIHPYKSELIESS